MNAGDRFGRYHIVRLIGRGAMGEVFLAQDTELQRQVAVKIVYKGPEPEDQEILDAERLGAELQKRLSGVDQRVVNVNRYGEISGDLFIEMELIDGEDLSAVVARGPVNPGFAAHVARELCEMLEKLRGFTTTIADQKFVGVIHGDLKPRNIRLNKQNHVKVLDFGIAKAMSHTRKFTMNVFASTAYCSPERLETQNMDSHSDLWSVGILLYQMIAQRLPFDEPTKERLERRIRSAEPPPPLPSSCPEPLRRITVKMLARDPVLRYQTAQEVRDDLVRFQNGEPVRAAAAPAVPFVVRALPFDGDATVRTGTTPTVPLVHYTSPVGKPGSGLPVDDRTVRSARTGAQAATVPRRSQKLFGCLATFAVACAIAIGLGLLQLNFWHDAEKLKSDLQTERMTNLDEGWNRYQTLSQKSHLPASMWGAESALRKRLVAAADQTISEYRNNDAPVIYEAHWLQARNDLSRALQLDPSDNNIKGRLRLCEGHIDRINAGGLHGPARQKKLNSAVGKFQEAAELMKHSPDPYLGLARLYVYELNDMDKAEEALDNAVSRGHPLGKRESAQLADGYRRRADRIWKESRGLTRAPDQERDYLAKARQDYIRAQDLYQKASLFNDSTRNGMQALQGQQRVEQRLSELQAGAVSQ